jgi:predicted lipoprotein with Yx(FWY)xxD motif
VNTIQAGLQGDIDTGDAHVLSASQLKTYKACPRKWGFKYLDKLPDPTGPGARFGTDVHKVLEDYFQDGKEPDITTRAGRLAGFGLRKKGLYPARSLVDHVEPKISLEVDGVFFRGAVDLLAGATVVDHKTSKDPAKYALTEDGLLTDAQSLIYSLWGLAYLSVNMLKLSWVYYQTAERVTPKVFSREVTVGPDQIQEPFKLHVLAPAKELVQAKKKYTTGNQLEPNLASCSDFGGCPFVLHCNKTASQHMGAAFGESNKNMPSLSELLAKKKAAQAPPVPNSRGLTLPPRVNSPEGPPNVEAQRAVSRVIENTAGNAKTSKATNRVIAAAAQGVEDPAQAGAAAETAQVGVEADANATKAPSLTKIEVLTLCAQDKEGIHMFTCSKSKAKPHIPYVAGRTMSSMVNYKLITKVDRTDGLKTVTITNAGRAEYRKARVATTPMPLVNTPAVQAVTAAAIVIPRQSDVTQEESDLMPPNPLPNAEGGDLEFLKNLLLRFDSVDDAKARYAYYLGVAAR